MILFEQVKFVGKFPPVVKGLLGRLVVRLYLSFPRGAVVRGPLAGVGRLTYRAFFQRAVGRVRLGQYPPGGCRLFSGIHGLVGCNDPIIEQCIQGRGGKKSALFGTDTARHLFGRQLRVTTDEKKRGKSSAPV